MACLTERRLSGPDKCVRVKIDQTSESGVMHTMNPTTAKARRQRTAVLIALCVAAAALAGFLGGRAWMEYRYPMLKNPAFHNLDAAYKEILGDYLNGAEAD